MISEIERCFTNIGVIADGLTINDPLNNYIEDSLAMISLIVELEKAFSIEFPDEYLRPDKMETINDIVLSIQTLQTV